MKILFVTNEIPYPPDNGVRIVSHHAMRLMHEAGHSLGLAVLTDEDDASEDRFNNISKLCQTGMSFWMPLEPKNRWHIFLLSIFKRTLFFVERYNSKQFRNKLQVLIEKFQPDVIHFDLITMLQYSTSVPAKIRIIASINDSYALTLQNSLSGSNYKGLVRIYRSLQYRAVKKYEADVYPKFDSVHVMTEVDALYLKSLNEKTNTVAIPNGVDESLFELANNNIGNTKVIFVAKLVGENLNNLSEFLDKGWSIVHKQQPDAELHIIGKIGADAHNIHAKYNNKDGIIFDGYIESLTDIYNGSGIAIVPINKNCGIINKAIEAMASGLAVVGFEKTFSGISGGHNEKHFVACNDHSTMAEAIIKLISNGKRLRDIQGAAHIFAQEHYAWSTRINKYENLYKGTNQK